MARAIVKTVGQSRKNYLINSNFDFWQRALTFNAPGQFSYVADRWYNQSTLNSGCQINRGNNQAEFTAAGISGTNYLNYLYNTAAPQMNLNQALEYSMVSELRGKTVTFSIYMKKNLANPRSYTIAIAKNASVDVISTGTWNIIASTLIPNASLGPNLTRFSVTATIPNDGTANGLKVMVYDNATGTAGDFITLAQASLNIGSVPAEYQTNGESPNGELQACQRYYQKTFPHGSAPVQNFGVTGAVSASSVGSSGYGTFLIWQLPVTMRASPATVTTYNPSANNSSVRNTSTSLDTQNTNVGASDKLILIQASGTNTGTVGEHLRVHVVADAEL
jgi:hypothetical protein